MSNRLAILLLLCAGCATDREPSARARLIQIDAEGFREARLEGLRETFRSGSRHDQDSDEVTDADDRDADRTRKIRLVADSVPPPPSEVADTDNSSRRHSRSSGRHRETLTDDAPPLLGGTRRVALNDDATEAESDDSDASPKAELATPDEVTNNASPAVDGALTLLDLEQMALANNPTIPEASASADRFAGLRYQAGRYPNPTGGYSAQQLFDAGTDQHVLFIEQEFVTGGKLGRRERVYDEAARAQMWQVEVAQRRVITDVRSRFYAALTAQMQVELTEQFEELLAKAVELAERRKGVMEGSKADILQAEIQLHEVTIQRRQAMHALAGNWRDLAAIAGEPNLPAVHLSGELRPASTQLDWDETYQRILSNSPEFAEAQARVQVASAAVSREHAEPTPNISTQLGLGYDNGTNSQMLNFQIGAPIPIFDKNEGRISAAHAAYCRATQEVRRLELSIRSRLARAAQEFDAAAAAVEEYETQILPRAEETLRLTELDFRAEQVDFLRVLLARQTYFESNLKYIESLGELAQAYTQIDGLLLSGGLDEPGEGWAE